MFTKLTQVEPRVYHLEEEEPFLICEWEGMLEGSGDDYARMETINDTADARRGFTQIKRR